MIRKLLSKRNPTRLKNIVFGWVKFVAIKHRGDDAFLKHDESIVAIYGNALPLHKFVVADEILALLINEFDKSKRIESCCSTSGADYVASKFKTEIYEKLNLNHSYLDCSTWHNSIENLISIHMSDILRATRSPFLVVNVRAWETKPDAGDFGPSAWHRDGMSRGHLKLMIYLNGLGNELASLEIEDFEPIYGPPGLAVVFQNSNLTHRARPTNGSSLRPVIEVTLMRTLLDPARKKPFIGHDNDRHLRHPYLAYSSRNFDLHKDER
jgi:hypothetical protein